MQRTVDVLSDFPTRCVHPKKEACFYEKAKILKNYYSATSLVLDFTLLEPTYAISDSRVLSNGFESVIAVAAVLVSRTGQHSRRRREMPFVWSALAAGKRCYAIGIRVAVLISGIARAFVPAETLVYATAVHFLCK